MAVTPPSDAPPLDLIACGHDYTANPDLVERLKSGAPLAAFDQATLYGGGREV